MKHFLTSVFAIAMLFCPMLIWADVDFMAPQIQDSTCAVVGKVYSELTQRPIENAKITVVDEDGKKFLTASGDLGLFKLQGLTPGLHEMTVTHVGYETFSANYDFVGGNNMVYIKLKTSSEEIEGASVVAQVELMRRIKDTTIYNAAAVRTDEWDDAIEILRQIPGVNVRGNNITIHGEKVVRTFVNGTLVFGDEPITAFNALRASDVKQIKVYDDLSVEDKRQGKKNGRKERIIDIVTHKKIVSNVRGEVFLAGGLNEKRKTDGSLMPHYFAYADAHLHSEFLQAEINVGADNVGESNITLSSPTYMSLKENADYRGGKFWIDKYWGDRMFGNNVYLHYDSRYAKVQTDSHSLTEYFQTGNTPLMTYADSSMNRSLDKFHSITCGVLAPVTPIKFIRASLSVKLADKDIDALQRRTETIGASNRSSAGSDMNTERIVSYGGLLEWKHNDLEKTKIFSIMYLSVEDGRSERTVIDTIGTALYPKSDLKGGGDLKNIFGYWNAGISYYLKNDDDATSTIKTVYGLNFSDRVDFQELWNHYGLISPVVDSVKSHDYRYRQLDHSLRLQYELDKRNLNLSVGLVPVLKSLSDRETFPETYSKTRHYFAVCPEFKLNYKRTLTVAINTDTQVPSRVQTRPKIDNLIPTRLSVGNPSLKQSYSTTLNITYNSKPIPDKPVLESSLKTMFAANPITGSMRYVTAGTILEEYGNYSVPVNSMLNTYENAPFLANVMFSAVFSDQIKKTRTPYHIQLQYSYRYMPQYAGGDLVCLREHSPILGATIRYRSLSGFMIRLQENVGYINARNDNRETINNSVQSSTSMILSYKPIRRLHIVANNRLSVSHWINLKRTVVENDMFISLTAELVKARLFLTVSGHDLLNNSQSYSINYTSDSRVQTWRPILGRYYMLSLRWRFRKNNL